jgi:5'(3')-deoxyribonucleotidase
MRVLCDVDGVLADFVGGVTRAAQALGSKTSRDWPVWDIWPNFEPDLHEEIEAAICAPGFAWGLSLFPGAGEAVNRIAAKHDLVFVTTPYDRAPTWVFDRAKWLRDLWPEIPIVFTKDKSLVRGDLLIEDNPEAAKYGHDVALIRRSYNDGTFEGVHEVAEKIC